MDTNLTKKMGRLGFELWHLGGGCTAWGRSLGGEAYEQIILSEYDIEAPRLDQACVLYRFTDEDQEEGDLVAKYRTLQQFVDGLPKVAGPKKTVKASRRRPKSDPHWEAATFRIDGRQARGRARVS